MARISLLLSLALVLAIGSVSAHPPSHKKTQKTLCPPTLSGLQSYPFIEISKIVQKKAHETTHETAQFKILFAICKGYTEYLGTFQKFTGSKNVLGMVHAKYAAMSSAMLATQATVGVEGALSVKLSKSYSGMAQGFVELSEKIAAISAKYKFKGNAKISQSDRTEIDNCLIKLKGSIRVFFKVISLVSKKCSAENIIDFRARIGGSFIGSFVKQGLGFGGHAGANVGALLGAHGAELGAKAGGKIGGKVGAHAGGKIGGKVGAHAGAKVGAHGGAKAGGQAGGKVGGLFGGILGFGGKVQFDAAGKVKVGGGNGFRSLSHPHSKHLV